jgi:hypothetical protein
MKTVLRFLSQAWRPAILVISLGLLAYLLYFHSLGNLLPGYAPAEATTYAATQSWHDLLTNPLNAPYKLVMLLLASTGHHHMVITRMTAAACGVFAVIVFFFVARAWYGFRVAFLGAMLFATSAGFLHFARLGSPQVLQMGVIALIGIIVWHRRTPRLHPYLTYVAVVVFGILLYVPGMVWFELLTILLIHKRILRHWSRSPISGRIAWPLAASLVALPLIIGLVSHPHLLMPALGIPSSFHDLSHLGSNLLDSLLAIGVRSDGNPVLWLGHSPLLNAAELILGALGVYYYVYQRRSLRSLLLAGTAIIGIVLASLGGGVAIACIVPILYLLITSGLSHLLDEWLTVFPRNPIARATGIVIICGMLFFSSLYHVRSYFVAWPHNTDTKQVFSLPRS